MDSREAGRYWEENAEDWTRLARAGYDVYRDHLNAPAFLDLLPDVSGLSGLDVGCGEGYNTRRFAERGARMTALDLSGTFVRYALEEERREPRGIEYLHADGHCLPFAGGSFDFATATMSLMDMPRPERAIGEVFRVLRPGGFLQFSIIHPCFCTGSGRVWVRDADGKKQGVTICDYREHTDGSIDAWTFSALPPEIRREIRLFRVPRFHRPLEWWVNTVCEAGFHIERFREPSPGPEALERVPGIADELIVPNFLQIRARKILPGTPGPGSPIPNPPRV